MKINMYKMILKMQREGFITCLAILLFHITKLVPQTNYTHLRDSNKQPKNIWDGFLIKDPSVFIDFLDKIKNINTDDHLGRTILMKTVRYESDIQANELSNVMVKDPDVNKRDIFGNIALDFGPNYLQRRYLKKIDDKQTGSFDNPK